MQYRQRASNRSLNRLPHPVIELGGGRYLQEQKVRPRGQTYLRGDPSRLKEHSIPRAATFPLKSRQMPSNQAGQGRRGTSRDLSELGDNLLMKTLCAQLYLRPSMTICTFRCCQLLHLFDYIFISRKEFKKVSLAQALVIEAMQSCWSTEKRRNLFGMDRQPNLLLSKINNTVASNEIGLYSRSMLRILMSSSGLSPSSALAFSISVQISMPFDTRPNTVCLLSSHGVGTVVMKNWLMETKHRNEKK